MNLSLRHYAYFWAATFLLLIGFVWLFKSVLTPFVVGFAIAYLLDPIVEKLVKLKIPRIVVTILILLLFLVFVVLTLVLVVPPLVREASALADNIPTYIDNLSQLVTPYLAMIEERLGGDYVQSVQNFLKENVGNIAKISGDIAGTLAQGGQAIANFLTILVLTPLVAFFTLMEWPRITKWIEDLIPRNNAKTIKGLLQEINQKVSGFVRGQITVAFILGVVYAVALSVADLNYGVLIGLMSGFLSIIPLVGSTFGLVASVAVAWFQSGGEWSFVLIIAGIFVAGQIIEGNILTPKLLGDSVGLHPLWILFALMAGGSLFGILGMMLAVPLAAVFGVLFSFAILQYKSSPLYKRPEKKKIVKKTAKKLAKKTKKKTVAKKEK